MIEPEKQCSKCRRVLAGSLFSPDKRARDGKYSACKECRSAAALEYYYKNKDACAERNKEWMVRNAEKRAEYRNDRKEIEREQRAAWYERNVGYNARYYKENKSRLLDKMAKYRSLNRLSIRAQQSASYMENPERAKLNARVNRHRRRAAEGVFTKSHIAFLMNAQNNKCAICRKSISKKKTIDHIFPIKLGGTNWPSNIQLLCPCCNRKKSAKHPIDFMQEIGFLL